MSELDVVIPVYNEGNNIRPTLESLAREVTTEMRVLVCYDREDDDTLVAIRDMDGLGYPVEFIKNQGIGAHGAVVSGFAAASAPYVVVMPADDDYNAAILDAMVAAARDGAEVVCASRFMPGGCMVGCRALKATLVRVAAFTLHHLARLPVRDATNGFRLFSSRVLDTVNIESTAGFCYSLELLVKCHRRGWEIAEVPARWYERKQGQSRFKIIRWLPHYLRWYTYAFATTYLAAKPDVAELQTNRT